MDCWVTGQCAAKLIGGRGLFDGSLTLIYMGYFDYLLYMKGAKKPPGLTLAFDSR